jgi:hypothetical protein
VPGWRNDLYRAVCRSGATPPSRWPTGVGKLGIFTLTFTLSGVGRGRYPGVVERAAKGVPQAIARVAETAESEIGRARLVGRGPQLAGRPLVGRCASPDTAPSPWRNNGRRRSQA